MPKLLIVDDEIDVREFAGNFFRKRGVQVFLASGGAEVFDIVANESPDLVLLDIRMEGMSGMDVLRRLRAKDSSVKVIMVSGIEDEEVVAEAKKLGVSGFIHKPLVLEELQSAVFGILNGNP